MIDLAELAAQVPWPDGTAETAVRDALDRAPYADGPGRLGEIASWLAGAQSAAPPTLPARPCALVFTETPTDTPTTPTWVPAAGDVGPVVNADEVGLSWRREPIAPGESAEDALAEGTRLADELADGGTDLVVMGHAGADPHPATLALISLLTSIEPVRLVPHRTPPDDAGWIRTVVGVRDARRRAAEQRGRTAELITAVADPAVARTIGYLLQAAVRRTPVILDGTTAYAAALAARELAPRAIRWWQIAGRPADAAGRASLERLYLEPILDLGTSLAGAELGAMCLPIVRAAVHLARSLPVSEGHPPDADLDDNDSESELFVNQSTDADSDSDSDDATTDGDTP